MTPTTEKEEGILSARTAAGALAGRILAISRQRLQCAMELAAARLRIAGPAGKMAFSWEDVAPAPVLRDMGGGIRVIDVAGMVSHGLDGFARWWLGAFEVDQLADAVEAAAADGAVKAIVVKWNSPGGMVQGVPEAALAVAAAAAAKPVLSWTSSVCASAAYWIASASSAVYARETAEVGSVGCYSLHEDASGWMAQNGFALDVFKSGEHKAAGIGGTRLSDEQRRLWQGEVDAIAAAFRDFVLDHRPEADAAVLDGRALDGAAAKEAGLVDETASFRDALADAAALAGMGI